MFSVEAMCNSVFLIDGIEYVVCILLDCSCEHDYFIVLAHFSEELLAVGAN